MNGEAAQVLAARDRRLGVLSSRERVVEVASALAMVAIAVGLPLAHPAGRFDLPVVGILVLVLAGLSRTEFEIVGGVAVPTQLAFVPLLYLAPPAWIPAAAVAGYAIGALAARRRPSLRPVVLNIGSCWFALGPTIVLLAVGQPHDDLGVLYLAPALLAAQIVVDYGNWALHNVVDESGGLPPWRAAGWLYSLDAILTPIALAGVFACGRYRFAFLLPVAVVALLELHRRERAAHFDSLGELSSAYRGTALLLGDMIGADDAYTAEHSRGVVDMARAVAMEVGIRDEGDLRHVEFAALLHDIGKTRIPKAILNKPGALTGEEWELMRQHPSIGAEMLESVGGLLAEVAAPVRHHHERYDGGGYPDGIVGEAIPLIARVIAVCDTFDAITTDRPYRAGRSIAEAIDELRRCAGSQLDPRVVEALATVVGFDRPFANVA